MKLSFSIKNNKSAILRVGLGSGEELTHVFGTSSSGVVSLFGKSIYTEKLNDNKWCLVDIEFFPLEKRAVLYIDGDKISEAKGVNIPEYAEGAVFEKNGFATVYLDDVSLKSNIEDGESKVVFISNSTYYANTIDLTDGKVYTYGQNRARYLNKLFLEGASEAAFVDATGETLNSEKVSAGEFLRFKNDDGSFIFYETEEGKNSYFSEANIDTEADEYNPDYDSYYIYEQPKSALLKGSALDMSYILDAPAGKYGYVKREGDHFAFSNNGETINFWGTNLAGTAAFPPTHQLAEQMADTIAAQGFNLVRIHNIDGVTYPNIYGATRGDLKERKLDDVQMERLCYLLAELKERGIYWYIDGAGSTKIYESDNVKDVQNGLSIGGGFWYTEDSLIAALEKQAELLFGYENPYTGLKIGQDPALACIDLNNENNLIQFDTSSYMGTECYKNFKAKFNEWLCDKYKSSLWGVVDTTRSSLNSAWTTKNTANHYQAGLQSDEDPTKGTVEIPNVADYQKSDGKWLRYCPERQMDYERFDTYMMQKYSERRIAHLRSIGVKCPVTGNTVWGDTPIPVSYANSKFTDFTDAHFYWSHPADSTNTLVGAGTRFNTNGGYGALDAATGAAINGVTSNLKADGLGFVGSMATYRVYGSPMTMSEWKVCPGNRYLSEGPLLVAAYGRLQGWNPVDFAFGGYSALEEMEGEGKVCLDSTFATLENPVLRAMFPSASAMFVRKDVSEAKSGYYYNYDLTEGTEGDYTYVGGTSSAYTWKGRRFFENMGTYGLVGKTGVAYGEGSLASTNNSVIKTKADNATAGDKVYNSLSGELSSDLKNGIFTMNTENSLAICGFIGGAEKSIGGLSAKVNNDYATITLTTITSDKISDSSRLLLTLAGDAHNYGQIMGSKTHGGGETAPGSVIEVAGQYPIMVEQITGEISIKLSGGGEGYKVYPLTSSGQRKAAIQTTATSDGLKFNITNAERAMNFEIVKE